MFVYLRPSIVYTDNVSSSANSLSLVKGGPRYERQVYKDYKTTQREHGLMSESSHDISKTTHLKI